MPSQQDKQKIQQTILTVIIMKKILFVALAAVGLTACVQNEELAISKSNAITFDNVYVGNATKAAIDGSYTSAKGNLDHFNVWATISNTNGTANIFEDEAVTKNNAGVWSYAVENTQYWIPGNNYSFVGVVDGDVVVDANAYNMPLTIATSLSSQKDVLYATQSRSYNGETVTPVHFDFEHLLAKVKFTAKNTVTTQYSELYYTVESIVITNADNEAVYSIANGTWTPSSTYTAEFGAVTTSNDAGATASNLAYGQNAESNYELLVLPQQNKSLNIKVNYTLHKDDWYQTYEKEMTAANLNIEKGRAYNFVLALGNPGASIDFTAEVEDWIDAIPSIDNTFAVATAEDLATIAEMVEAGEDFTGKTVTLVGDIDLSATTRNAVASNWTPIGTSDKPFTGAFDGNGYTIKNLTLVEPEAKEGKAYMGFFGYAKNATIKNVTFENVYINIPCLDIDHSQGHIGAVAGSLEGTSTIENVTVKGAVQIYTTQDANGASRVAVIAGGNSYGNVTMKNVHVVADQGSYLVANNNVGALAGQLQGKMVFENCSSNINVTANKFFAGGLVGIAAGDSYIKDCHTTGDVAVVAGREGRHNDEFRVGGIAGGWADGATKVCTLENCSYTGTVSGQNVDGAVAEPLDYMGYVGRGYTLTNCAGSKVVIDGVEYVQLYNDKYGIYSIDGRIPVATSEELTEALKNGGAYLTSDVTTSSILKVAAGAVLDGNGKTLTANGVDAYESFVAVTEGTLQNVTVKGAYRALGTGGSGSYPMTGDAYFKNVTTEGATYGFNISYGNGHKIYVDNCTIGDWNSYAGLSGAEFTNCTFIAQGNYKAAQRVYGDVTFTYKNCTFPVDDPYDHAKYHLNGKEGKPLLIFENCKMSDGTILTKENFTTYFGGSNISYRVVNE